MVFRLLHEEGIFVGGSAGLNVCGAGILLSFVVCLFVCGAGICG